jgi:hypothetical protein
MEFLLDFGSPLPHRTRMLTASGIRGGRGATSKPGVDDGGPNDDGDPVGEWAAAAVA